MNSSSRALNTLVLLVVMLVLAVFDAKLADDVFRQYGSGSFPCTTGRVYSSEVTVTHGSKGSIHYHVHIFYEYSVAGQTYDNATFRYGPFSPNSTQAHAEVDARPVGSKIPVYYRPENPADSLLSPGLVGGDFQTLFLFTPITVYLLYQLGAIFTSDWLRRGLPAGGVSIHSHGSQISARLPRYTPGLWSMWTFCGVTFAAGLILMLVAQGSASTRPEAFASVIILIATAGVFWWRQHRLLTGVDDLVINQDARTLLLPQTFDRPHRISMKFEDLELVRVESVRHRSRYSYYYTWAVLLEKRNASNQPEKLTDWSSREKSAAFAAWLGERLNLPVKNQPPDN